MLSDMTETHFTGESFALMKQTHMIDLDIKLSATSLAPYLPAAMYPAMTTMDWSIHKQQEERNSGFGIGFLKPQNPPPVSHFLQEGHTS